MIGRHKDFSIFTRTDMYVWHGIRSSTERRLAGHIRAWQDAGYAFTYKVFPNMGHGTLAGEHTEQLVPPGDAHRARADAGKGRK